MTTEQKEMITKISQEFASGFKDTIGEIAGSGWLIVDPLSAYLQFCGFENKLVQMPPTDSHPLILIMQFKDGSQFIPAGSDIPLKGAKDWQWID